MIPAALVLWLVLNPYRLFAANNGYVQHNIVSDIPLIADLTDPNLVNPWGITPPNFWVCDQGTGLSTVYTNSTANGAETVTTIVVTVPPPPSRTTPGGTCTGIVDNATAGAFAPSSGVNANFIFATQDGTISARTGTTAVIKVDNSAAGAVYDGLAIFNSASANYLYAANFHAGTIDVFDSNYNKFTPAGSFTDSMVPAGFAPFNIQNLGDYNKFTPAGSFTDSMVPAGFAPFNIQNLGGKLYVTYAKQDPIKRFDIAGVGNGYVAVFDTNGNLLQHLISGGPLNSPWGIQIAPASFGAFANDLLVGNLEDGLINAFNPSTGAFIGGLQDPSGNSTRSRGCGGCSSAPAVGPAFPILFTSPPEFPWEAPAFKLTASSAVSLPHLPRS